MSLRVFGGALAIAAIIGQAGCAQRQAWQYDESRRIDEVMSSKFSDDLAALNGTAFSAPPSNAPPLPASSYEIQHAPKKRSKPSRGSKRRARQYDDVTSQDGGADSASRRP